MEKTLQLLIKGRAKIWYAKMITNRLMTPKIEYIFAFKVLQSMRHFEIVRKCIVTLVFTVRFQMSPQIVCLRRCIVTLVAFSYVS